MARPVLHCLKNAMLSTENTIKKFSGQFRKVNTNHYVDGPGKSSISRWRNDFQKEFEERADRCIKPKSEASETKPR